MEQLTFFTENDPFLRKDHNNIKRKKGRPREITYNIIFETKKLISSKNQKLSNSQIIDKIRISKSAFFRIKRGDYDNFFNDELEKNISSFQLTKTD